LGTPDTDSQLSSKEQKKVVCAASENEDTDVLECVPDPHHFEHSASANEKAQTDSQVSSKDQEKEFCAASPHNFEEKWDIFDHSGSSFESSGSSSDSDPLVAEDDLHVEYL